MKALLLCLFLFLVSPLTSAPVFFDGRVHPHDVYASTFSTDQPFAMHVLGHEPWDDQLLFKVSHPTLISLLGSKKVSYHQLLEQLPELLLNYPPENIPSLVLTKERAVKDVPRIFPFHYLQEGHVFPANPDPKLRLATQELIHELIRFSQMKADLEPSQSPLKEQLLLAGSSYQALPTRFGWVSLKALKLKIPNFTLYSDKSFLDIQEKYLALDQSFDQAQVDALFASLDQAYLEIAGKKQQKAHGKALFYPTASQLKAESFLHSFPFLQIIASLYLLAMLFYFLRKDKLVLSLFVLALLVQTAQLALRSYALGRPPVSNMFETVIYVPWVSAVAGLIFYGLLKVRALLFASSFTVSALLFVLSFSQFHQGLENVQAVLNSQYWLMVHVLMVVGSYGFFILAGVLGHLYFFTNQKEKVGNVTLQMLYLGTAFLIVGTVLGGVWAAQSWGRFWDWDPKESWAFISCCTYLILIHLYRFRHIGFSGLAIGSIVGLLVISFTWYGVNYILGTGLHSYGFGEGGVFAYTSFVLAELIFLGTMMRKLQLSK